MRGPPSGTRYARGRESEIRLKMMRNMYALVVGRCEPHTSLFRGESSLVLARDAADVDLSSILTQEDVGMTIQEVATSLRNAFLEQKRVLERLPQMAQRPVTFTGARDCWRASSGAGQAYLYYQDGPTSIQVTCLPICENPPAYTVKIQSAPNVPWADMTDRVRGCASMDRAVRRLLSAPIS